MITISRRGVFMTAAAFLVVASLALASMVLTLTQRAEANDNFNDIATGTFFHDPANFLEDNGIADGFSDGTFRPNDSFTRGQAAYWFSNYNKTIELLEASINPASGTSFNLMRSCPAGKHAVAGGGIIPGSNNIFMTLSRPVSNGWQVFWETELNASVNPTSLTVWALCVPNNI